MVSLLFAAALVAQALPAPTTTPGTLHFDIPPGWHRTSAGEYNEWRSPDGTTNFRVTVFRSSSGLFGPKALETVEGMFKHVLAPMRPNADPHAIAVRVCNGKQTAYRVNDPFGTGSAGFIMIIPGTQTAGLINLEAHSGKPDPSILRTIDKICWP